MAAVRQQLIDNVWFGIDPFHGFPMHSDLVNGHGWGSTHHYLEQAVEQMRPGIVVEIGVWMGGSTMTMARRMRQLGLDGVVVSVDTWLGAWDHWTPEWFSMLKMRHGRPTLQDTFMANVIDAGLQDYVLPLPLDSANAGMVLQRAGVMADVIHLDAAHDYEAVRSDLALWWPRLRPGGVLIGDDYWPGNPDWPGVTRAFDELVAAEGLEMVHVDNKCWVRKPG